MKSAKEILNLYSFVNNLSSEEYLDLLGIILFAQNNAYNQAIDDVNNLIDKHDEEVYIGVVNYILKLKK